MTAQGQRQPTTGPRPAANDLNPDLVHGGQTIAPREEQPMSFRSESATTEADATAFAVIYHRLSSATKSPDGTEGRALSECERQCADRSYFVEEVFSDDDSGWTLNRPGLKALTSHLIRKRPDVLVIRDWTQVGRRPVDRAAFARTMALIGMEVEALYPGGEPDVSWDPTDDKPSRVARPNRNAA